MTLIDCNEFRKTIGINFSDEDVMKLLHDDFDKSYSVLCAVIAELTRYAMFDLSNSDTSMSPVHTSSLNNWVQKKTRALLLPLGVSEQHIRRAILCTMGMKSYTQDERQKWYDSDRWHTKITSSGEILRVGDGYNISMPDRLIVIDDDLVMLISSKPTLFVERELQSHFDDFKKECVKPNGLIRTISRKGIGKSNIYQNQPLESFIGIPPEIYELLKSNNQSHLPSKLLEFVRNQGGSRTPRDLQNEINSQPPDFNYDMKYCETERFWFNRNVILNSQIMQYRLIKFESQYAANEYFLPLPEKETTPLQWEASTMSPVGGVKLYPVEPKLIRYIMRILAAPGDKPTIKVNKDRIEISHYPPASGKRLLMIYGAEFISRGVYRIPRGVEELANNLVEWNLYRRLDDD